MNTLSEILEKNGFRGEIAADSATREIYSRDASLFQITPDLVVTPLDTDDVKNLVCSAIEARKAGIDCAITARSAGTDMSGGPLSTSIVADFTKHLNHIVHVSPTEATTQPGVYYRDFDKETLKQGVILPSYPASREICTVNSFCAILSAQINPPICDWISACNELTSVIFNAQ